MFKNISTKTIVIVLMPLALGLIVYLFVSEINSDKKEEEKKEEAFPVPGVEKGNVPESKRQAYENWEKKNERRRKIMKKMDDDNFYNMEADVSKKEKEPEEEEKEPKKKENPYIARDSRLNKKSKKTTTKSRIDQRREKYEGTAEKEEKKENKEEEEEEEIKEKKVYSSFGISDNTDNGLQNTVGFIEATLEESYKVKDGSEVVFILQDDCVIDGKFIEKLSLLYGKVKFGDQRIYVDINMIRNVDGNRYNVDLTGFNENYQQGIYYDGSLDEARDKSQNKILSDGASNLTTTGQITNLIKGAARETTRSLKKEPEISISKGYKMYFKNEKDN
jgi:hypothetical protein